MAHLRLGRNLSICTYPSICLFIYLSISFSLKYAYIHLPKNAYKYSCIYVNVHICVYLNYQEEARILVRFVSGRAGRPAAADRAAGGPRESLGVPAACWAFPGVGLDASHCRGLHNDRYHLEV